MTVVVGHHGPVLAVLGYPAGYPVQLPLQHEGAVREALLLLAVQDDPASVLDSPGRGAACSGHRGRTRAHPAFADHTLPGNVPVEAAQCRHLRPGRDGPGDLRGITAGAGAAWYLAACGHILDLSRWCRSAARCSARCLMPSRHLRIMKGSPTSIKISSVTMAGLPQS